MMNVSSLQSTNVNTDSWNPYSSLISEMLQEPYRSPNASFYAIIKPISSLESSGQTFNRDIQEELFLNRIVIDEKKDEVLITTPVDHIIASLWSVM